MDPLRIFDIPFVGLTEGEHSYDYTLDGSFFEEFGNEDLKTSSFNVQVDLEKKATHMELSMAFNGSCTVPCDRCDAPLNLPREGEMFLVVRFGEGPDDLDEVIFLAHNETTLNIAQPIFEMIALSLPAKRKHKKKDCDPKAIEALENLSRVSEEETDPRWEVLRKLKNKDDK